MARIDQPNTVGLTRFLLLILAACGATSAYGESPAHRNAYATMMYMGTPRDYEFYVAIRVLLRSLARLNTGADRVVIASRDVPVRWVQAIWQRTSPLDLLQSGRHVPRITTYQLA